MWLPIAMLLASPPTPSVTPAVSTPPSLLLITLDTTRADHLGCYGAKPSPTPEIDRLAARGVRFAQVVAASPLTLPSHATIMTGRAVRRHGISDNGLARLADDELTLAEVLKARGYATHAFIASAVLDRSTGIAQGFSQFDDRVRLGKRSWFDWTERAASQVNAAVVATLPTLRPPFFLWVHYYDPHRPHVAPEPFQKRFARAPYDAEIAAMDHAVGELLQALARHRLDQNLLIAAAGDHGESLGEHGESQHGVFLYQATLRVPWILSGPGVPAGKVISQRVGLVDLFPTVLDLLGATSPATIDGRTTRPLWSQTKPAWTARYEAETLYPLSAFGWSPLVALIDGDSKWIAAPAPERYDLSKDPKETQNLFAERDRPRLAELEARVQQLASSHAPAELSAEDQERLATLNSLGYAASTVMGPSGADPKTQIATVEQLETARQAIAAGKFEQAIAQLESLVAAQPHNQQAWLTLARAFAAAGRSDEALVQYRTISQRWPEDPQGWFLLGSAQSRRGGAALDEAEAALTRCLTLSPRHAEAFLALILVHLQRNSGTLAWSLVEEADRRGVEDQDLLLVGARLAMRQGRRESARQRLERVVALDPTHVEALDLLAEWKLKNGDPAGAADGLRRVLELAPTAARARALGAILADKLGDRAGARTAYELSLQLESTGPEADRVRATLLEWAP
jgi:arylsulfatase A-like enzyme/predicted TPR repeat methyltransferase